MVNSLNNERDAILKNLLANEEPEDNETGLNEDIDTGNEDDFDNGDEDDFDQPLEASQEEEQPVEEKQPTQQPTAPVANADAPLDTKKLGFKADKAGNLVDAEGKIVFTAGRSRALYEKVKGALYKESQAKEEILTEFNKVTTAARELLGRYNTLKEDKNYGEKLGLTPDENKQAAEMMAQMKLDPKTGIKKILTMVHLAGTDLSDIGVKGPLDAKEVARHMLELQEAKKPKEKSAEDAAKEEGMAFLGRHPDAVPHVQMIADAKMRFPHMSLDQIWFEIKRSASRPAPTAPVEKPTRQRQPAQKPGRIIPRNGNRSQLSLKPADTTKSFSDIGRELLRDINNLEAN